MAVRAALCIVKDGEPVASSRWWVVPEDQAEQVAAEFGERFGPHIAEGLRDLVNRRDVYVDGGAE